jgi:hypothetical protein
MPCYRPLRAWRARSLNPSGKRGLVFNRRDGFEDLPVEVPCGQCIGCRLERSRQWAIRCVHEASLYEDNCFITLTYDNEHLPLDGSLNVSHFQKFMKRLRKANSGRIIRFMHCGEYGEEGGRPHYHAILFNFDFEDKELFQVKGDHRVYTSVQLQRLWPFGFCLIGSVTFASAAYVARYITKKVTGESADDHYQGKKPEYITMSRRPGIGKGWFDKYSSDVYPSDFVVINGKRVGVPKFYDNQLPESDLKKFKALRKYESYKYADNNTLKRLDVREICHEARASLLKRSFEDG